MFESQNWGKCINPFQKLPLEQRAIKFLKLPLPHRGEALNRFD